MFKDFFHTTIRFSPDNAGGGGTGNAGNGTVGAGDAGSNGRTGGGAEVAAGAAGGTNGMQANTQIDYDRIQQMLDGTLKAKEETALKAYFKQQGLTQEQAQQAINDFKAQQAANTPDAAALQAQVVQAQTAQRQAEIQSVATMAAVELGLDAKTIPYVLKMADLSKVTGEDGQINNETLLAALKQVLDDVPALKPQASGTGGFVQVGAAGNASNQTQDDQLAMIFGNKK